MDDKYYAQRQEIALKKWESATIQNNFIFSKTMEMNPKLCKELIECILNREIENITYPEREKVIENRIDSKGVRLDVYAKDDKENIFDLYSRKKNYSCLPVSSAVYAEQVRAFPAENSNLL